MKREESVPYPLGGNTQPLPDTKTLLYLFRLRYQYQAHTVIGGDTTTQGLGYLGTQGKDLLLPRPGILRY